MDERKKRNPKTVTDELLKNLDLPLDSATLDHELQENIENTQSTPSSATEVAEKNPTPHEWAPVFEEPTEKTADLEPAPTPINHPPSDDDWESLFKWIHSRHNQKNLREIQERIGSRPDKAMHLKVTWPTHLRSAKEAFRRQAQTWVRPSEWPEIMTKKGNTDTYPFLEKALAYELLRYLRRIGCQAEIHTPTPSSRSKSGKSLDNLLEYETMSQNLYGANLPNIPISADSERGSKNQSCLEVEQKIALPPYYNESNQELTCYLAERIIRLKAAENLAKKASDFKFEIIQENDQRYLRCHAKLWL